MDDTLFSRHFIWLKLAATCYVLALPLAHGLLPVTWVWPIAATLLWAMLFTYPVTACLQRDYQRTEVAFSLVLAGLGLCGLWLSPLLIIFAIAAHGVWDLAKHRGCGVAFFGWYTKGCCVVDFSYATALTLHWSL